MPIKTKQLALTNSITNAMINDSAAIAISKLAQKSITINGTSTDLGDSITLDTGDISESGNLYFTDARAQGAFSVTAATGEDVQLLTKSGGALSVLLSDVFSEFSAGTGLAWDGGGTFSLSANTDNVQEAAEATNQYFTQARARGAVSVTDNGGDGSLAYNDSTGVFTYTGPSAAEVRAHISAGTGVAIADGVVSIGQAVGTSSNVQFNDATITGNLTVNGTTTTVNSNTVNIGDNIIVLNSDETGTPSQDAGIEIERGTADNLKLYWDETNDLWKMQIEGETAGSPLNLSIAAIEQFQDNNGFSFDSSSASFTVNLHTNGGLSFDGTSKGIKVLAHQGIQTGTGGELELKLAPNSGLLQDTNGLAIGSAGVSSSMIAADAITEAKIANNAVQKEHLNSNVIRSNGGLALDPTDNDLFVKVRNGIQKNPSGGELELKLASDSGLLQDSNGLKVDAGGIVGSMIAAGKFSATISSPAGSGTETVDFTDMDFYSSIESAALTAIFLNGVKLRLGANATDTVGSGGIEVLISDNGAGKVRLTLDATILSDGDYLEAILCA